MMKRKRSGSTTASSLIREVAGTRFESSMTLAEAERILTDTLAPHLKPFDDHDHEGCGGGSSGSG